MYYIPIQYYIEYCRLKELTLKLWSSRSHYHNAVIKILSITSGAHRSHVILVYYINKFPKTLRDRILVVFIIFSTTVTALHLVAETELIIL